MTLQGKMQKENEQCCPDVSNAAGHGFGLPLDGDCPIRQVRHISDGGRSIPARLVFILHLAKELDLITDFETVR